MLLHFGVKPYLVFDGDYLPSKGDTEASREKRREESKQVGLALLKAGKTSQAHLELQKAIDVTPAMTRLFIEELKKANVSYVVAPYEADAQLVYLEREGLISGIISEDSDLLVFGAKRLLTKLDQYGQCVEINRRDFCAVREISLTGWTDTEFRCMAILSGCDYLKGLDKIGLKTAYRLVRKYKTPEKIVRMLQLEGKHRIPEDYLESFKNAEATFLYQRVFCPRRQALVHLTAPDPVLDLSNMPCIGSAVPPDVARAIAVGDLNPITKQRIRADNRFVAARRAQQAQTTNLKARAPMKSIGNYFRGAQRVPLGEMDPNCFAPQPSSNDRFRDSGQHPVVFPLPRPYIAENEPRPAGSSAGDGARRRTEPNPVLVFSGRAVLDNEIDRRQTAGPIFKDPTGYQDSTPVLMGNDTPHPPPKKKPRLCDELLGELLGGVHKSKFFGIRSNVEGSGGHNVMISPDEPSTGAAAPDRPSIDGERQAPVAEKDPNPRSLQQISRPTLQSPRSLSFGETSNALANVKAPLRLEHSLAVQESDTADRHVSMSVSLQNFFYQPPARNDTTSSATKSPSSSVQPKSKTLCFKPTIAPSRFPSALERMRIQAVRRDSIKAGPALPRQSLLSRQSSSDSPHARPVTPAVAVQLKSGSGASSIPLDAGGSEDQIIPESDGEDEEP